MVHPSHLRGVASMLLATGAFVANDTCMKLVVADAPPFQVLVMRGISASLWCLPIVLFMGHGQSLRHLVNPWVLLRCASEVAAILCFIVALSKMPIADITAMSQIAPLLVLIGASLFWGDRIGPLRYGLIALGILGALLVAQPGTSAASPYAFIGFAVATGAALRDICSRKVPLHIPALIVTFATILTVLLAALVLHITAEDWAAPNARQIGLMAIAGLFLVAGHFFVFLTFRLAPARVVAPFTYSFMLWAVLSGFVVFRDLPNALALTGMLVILGAGLGVIFLESREGAARPGNVTDT